MKDHFNQQTACKAPNNWSKCTTCRLQCRWKRLLQLFSITILHLDLKLIFLDHLYPTSKLLIASLIIVKILNLLYHAFMYSLLLLLSGIYPFTQWHSFLVTIIVPDFVWCCFESSLLGRHLIYGATSWIRSTIRCKAQNLLNEKLTPQRTKPPWLDFKTHLLSLKTDHT